MRMRLSNRLLFGLALAGATTLTGTASAQSRTFHLDRLEVPGGPDDGLALFRPVVSHKAIVYGQTAFGYTLNPLHTRNITTDATTIHASGRGVVKHQFTQYFSAGFQFLERFSVGLTLPVAWYQAGQNPRYPDAGITSSANSITPVGTDGTVASDIRIDARAVIARTANGRGAFGGQVSLFAPNGSTQAFGGNGQTTALFLLAGDYDLKFLTLTANTGVHFRPSTAINDPTHGSGLGVGNEWRWATGAFIPLKEGKFRIGGTIFGQTGITSGGLTGNTSFTTRNTPIEWNAEARIRFGKVGPFDDLWAGGGGGSLIVNGYGAPDMRIVALVGTYIPVVDTNPVAPDPKAQLRAKWQGERGKADRDHDGIPDEIDACPDQPEDHLGKEPNDGCPLPPDRDGDGIPDSIDQCPDQPEDFDGLADDDGCPEDDFDKDGVPDTSDACPREPGQPSPDPAKNGCPQFIKMEGSVIRILQQVHFATASATILPDSFPMLQEIVNLLQANAKIRRIAIEGHTDNRGGADMNQKLSQARSESVMRWLAQHGVAKERLEAHGYGLTRPIESNNTDKGRAANRRVEFHILDEGDKKP